MRGKRERGSEGERESEREKEGKVERERERERDLALGSSVGLLVIEKLGDACSTEQCDL